MRNIILSFIVGVAVTYLLGRVIGCDLKSPEVVTKTDTVVIVKERIDTITVFKFTPAKTITVTKDINLDSLKEVIALGITPIVKTDTVVKEVAAKINLYENTISKEDYNLTYSLTTEGELLRADFKVKTFPKETFITKEVLIEKSSKKWGVNALLQYNVNQNDIGVGVLYNRNKIGLGYNYNIRSHTNSLILSYKLF